MKIFVVDNGGQWTHREWRVLRDLGVETKIIPNTTPLKEIEKENVDGLVLSGGAARIGWESARLGEIGEYLNHAKIPIIGLCVGHQFMALHFGGKAGPSTVPEFGKTKVTVKRDSPIFKGFPKTFIAWESHNDEIKELPDEFEILASSENCLIQAIHHKEKPFYGLQYHPEVEDTEFGYEIFKNFIEICKKYKSEK
ncbi:MAG: GMP synthase subunit A [Candidatus Aenigmarchaeota archaeon]|nr:GMP synthase subunit A [Candidatus Aenigmarchaeota archaeon]